MKKIMIIAGGNWQIPLIKKAKEMGHYVINTNLYEDSPAFRYADAYEVANVLDKEKNLEIARKYQPDAIITDQSDIAVPTVAYLCEQLGLPGIGTKHAELFTNKYLMRNFCEENGFTSPKHQLCNNIDEAREFLHKYGKIVIKPLDSQASRGVFTICADEELEECFEITKGYTNCNDCVLAEEFVMGVEFTVDGIMWDGKHRCLAISEKKHYKEYANVASELMFTYSKYDTERLAVQHNALVEKMGLPFGLTHAEYIYSKEKDAFYLVEVAARGGGTNISGKIVTEVSGVDNMAFLIKAALGESISPEEINSKGSRYAVLKFFDFTPGKVKTIRGKEYLDNCSSIIDYNINYTAGETIGSPTDDSKRPGHYIAVADTYEALKEIMDMAASQVVVEYEE